MRDLTVGFPFIQYMLFFFVHWSDVLTVVRF